MKEETIHQLPKIFQDNICTIKNCSLYDKPNRKFMCDSQLTAINFDRIPKYYSQGKGWAAMPKSNDALYIKNHTEWYFIEFKNGTIRSDDIYQKIYDSILILLDLKLIPDLDFCRQNIHYILVYNKNKFKDKSQSLQTVHAHTQNLAKGEQKLFDLANIQGRLFAQTHTYTLEEFTEHFLIPIEEWEKHLPAK